MGHWAPSFAPLVGLRHPGIDTSWAFSWTDKQTKLQANGTHFRNTATDYQSGDAFHWEWAVGFACMEGPMIDVVGYDPRLITGESGSGDKSGDGQRRYHRLRSAVYHHRQATRYIQLVPLSRIGIAECRPWRHDDGTGHNALFEVTRLFLAARPINSSMHRNAGWYRVMRRICRPNLSAAESASVPLVVAIALRCPAHRRGVEMQRRRRSYSDVFNPAAGCDLDN
jgi:hypothetical protein